MKTFGKGKMSFGLSIVNAGQRQVSVEPEIVFVSTPGAIRITGPVSKALGIQHGDNIMFINTVDLVSQAIIAKAEEIVSFCEANGLDIESPEAAAAIHKEFDEWYIAKGIQKFDRKGNPRMIKERLTKEDRLAFVEANFEEMFEGAKQSNDEALVAQLTREDITEAEIKDILCKFVTNNETPEFEGSKAANPAKLTGFGVGLNFTDSAIWMQIKEDLGADADKVNRTYAIDLDKIETVKLNNGFQDVDVVIAPFIGADCAEPVDETPARVGKKAAAEKANKAAVEAAE